MQGEDAEVQAQQVRVLEGGQQRLARHAGFAVLQRMGRARHHDGDDQHPHQGHDGGGPEQPGKAEGAGQQRADHHGHGEGHADAHADHGHGLGAVLFPGEVREQRHHRCGDGAGALQHAAGDHPPDGIGVGRQGRARGEDQQADIDHRQAADTVGDDAERNLQHGLGQAIGTDGQADQGRGGAGQVLAIGGQDRQYHEHAEHAEGEHQGQAAGSARFAAAHTFRVGVLHRCLEEERSGARVMRPCLAGHPFLGARLPPEPEKCRAF
ncbi:hypothetical protein D9M68_621710 [compost metagenome]